MLLKHLPFGEKYPRFRFNRVRNFKRPQGQLRYNHVISVLKGDILAHIIDIIHSLPNTGRYGKVKLTLIEHLCESENRQLKKLLTEIELGDMRSSHLLREMRQLASTFILVVIITCYLVTICFYILIHIWLAAMIDTKNGITFTS